jgi:phospholipid/cholesterol/gamma-HCH transport system substrate-binding protein
MKRLDVELAVGVFVIVGVVCLGWLSVQLGGVNFFGNSGYELHAAFRNVGVLKAGADVVIAGVPVGRVKTIRLDLKDYRAAVVLHIEEGTEIQDDAIACIKTKGLIGEKYVEILPGGSPDTLGPGDTIWETQPVIDIESLISKAVFNSKPAKPEE